MRREKGRPQPDEPLSAQPGARMLVIPSCPGDPMRLAEESIEELKREQPPRVVKTSKRKRKASR
jgi:hypothetical protein